MAHTDSLCVQSVHGDSHHWRIWTVGDIVNTKSSENTDPETFRVYLRTTEGVSAGSAASLGWSLRWCGVGDVTKPPTQNMGMCCGSGGNWKTYVNGHSIYADIDTSAFFPYHCAPYALIFLRIAGQSASRKYWFPSVCLLPFLAYSPRHRRASSRNPHLSPQTLDAQCLSI